MSDCGTRAMVDTEVDLREWLMSNCGLSRTNADSCCETLEKDGIDNFAQLRLCINQDSTYLESTKIPRMIQMTIRKRIMELDHVSLESLYASQVKVLMMNVFPENRDYADAYFIKGVSGFVLKAPNMDVGKLKELGNMTQIHAEALIYHVGQWRLDGVPCSKLIDPTYANVKNDPTDGGSSIISDLHGEPREALTLAVKQETLLRVEQVLTSHQTPSDRSGSSQNRVQGITTVPALSPAKVIQQVEEVVAEVPVLAQPMDILTAVASVASVTAVANTSRGLSEEEAEMSFDEGVRTLSGGEESESSDARSVSSASASGLSDTSDDDSQDSAPRGSATKRPAPSSTGSGSAKRVKKSSPGRREVMSLLRETNPPPKSTPKSQPGTSTASPRVNPKHEVTSSSASKAKSAVATGAKPAAKVGAETSKTKLARLMSAAADEEDLVDVLLWTSKQVLNPGGGVFIRELNSLGATTHMINMLCPTPKKHSEYVVWKVLVVLNNIVFKDGGETHFLVERELVARVLPLCESTVKRVRLQALWILGNMSAQKEAVIQTHIYTPKVVDTIVKGYATIGKMTNPGGLADNVRQRYAETILNIVVNGLQMYTPLLEMFLPVLHDIFHKEEDHEALKFAFDALWNLFHAGQQSTLDAALAQEVIAGLIARISDKTRSTELLYTLNLLLEYVDQRGEDPNLNELAGAVDPLCKVITSASVNKKIIGQALDLLNVLGDAKTPTVAQRVLASSSQMVERLSSLVVSSDAEGLVANISKASAEILLTAAEQDRTERTIADLLNRGFYATLFKILGCFEDAWILESALSRLAHFAAKVENLLDYQKNEGEGEDFNAADAWELVVDLSLGTDKEQEPVRVAARTLLALARHASLTTI